MPDHLLLPEPRPVGSRRAGGGGGQPPSRERTGHGRKLRQQLRQIVAAPRRLDLGVDPDLVFKLAATARPGDGALEGRGLQVLGETREFTYFVLASDEAAGLASVLSAYTADGTQRSLIDLIDALEPYGPDDRRGSGLDPLPTTPTRVDITVWPSETYPEAQRRARIVETILDGRGITPERQSISSRRSLIRAVLDPEALADVLAISVVERVRTPPIPFLDWSDWRTLAADDLHRTEHASAVVGVLDDAPASGHPLLTGLIESIDPIGPADYPWQQPGHHGTQIAGRVLLPDLMTELRDGIPITARGTLRVARILEPVPNDPDHARFATSWFVHELVETAIRDLHQRYGVRVFNLSAGFSEPYDDLHLGELTETIDELVRELGIVVVVPTGNTAFHQATTPSGHHVVEDYPTYLLAAEQRLAEPGPAALAITVGAVAHSDAPAELPNRLTWRAAATVDQLSPFSRVGPGTGPAAGRHNKPDVVHDGGNAVVNDVDLVVRNEAGASIVSTALNATTGALFSACNGTSFAAPAVARVAADISHAYPDASANLVRALLAQSASRIPQPSDPSDDSGYAALYGLGRPNSDRAISSGARCATMIFDGAMAVDTVKLHPVPVPEAFRVGSGAARTITLTLAFDPPVRRQRREYLAAAIQLDLYRDIDPDDLAAILERQDRDDSRAPITDRRRLTLRPGSNSLRSTTLQRRSWTATNSFANDADVFYVAVTHRAATWARDTPEYTTQDYALTVTLEDQQLQRADLRALLVDHVRLPARVRIRGG